MLKYGASVEVIIHPTSSISCKMLLISVGFTKESLVLESFQTKRFFQEND